MSIFLRLGFLALLFAFYTPISYAALSETVVLKPGWNIVSTPKLLESHTFSAAANSSNFDIYVLDSSRPTKWATMADLGQVTFQPLFGYYVQNKTGVNQTLTFNYDTSLAPNEKLFERVFATPGWYSIGVANATYAKAISANQIDSNNPSQVLSSLSGNYDSVIDFTNADFQTNRTSVSLTNPWRSAVSSDINSLNDLREHKGYAIYITQAGARYAGFQNDPVPAARAIQVRTSDENPDAAMLGLEDTTISDWLNIFAFNLTSSNSNTEVTIESIQLEVEVSQGTVEEFMADATLQIGEVPITDYIMTAGGTTKATLIFDVDGAVTIAPDDTVTASLLLKFDPLSASNEGTNISARVTVADAQAFTFSDATEVSGSVVGSVHTMRTSSAEITPDSDSVTVSTVDGNRNDFAVYQINLDVTGFQQDVFIPKNTNSLAWKLVDPSGNEIPTPVGSHSVAVVSSADVAGEGNAFYHIQEGETETITVYVTYAPGTSSPITARLQLFSIKYDSSGTVDSNNDQTWEATPLADYRTDFAVILN